MPGDSPAGVFRPVRIAAGGLTCGHATTLAPIARADPRDAEIAALRARIAALELTIRRLEAGALVAALASAP
jgi:hypothetical protein